MFAYLRSLLNRRPAKAAKTIRRTRLDLELLERRETPAIYSKLALDFGPASAPVQKGFTGVNAGEYQAKRGYGWVPSEGVSVVDRGVGTRLTRDFLQANDHYFKASVRKGWYQVTVWFGDATLARSAVGIRAEGVLTANIPATAAGEWTTQTFYVRVTDGMFNVRFTAAADRFAINALKLVKVTAPPPDPVNENGPIATLGNSGAVNEGSTGTVSFTSVAGGSGGYKYSYDFDNNGSFEVTGSASATATVPASYLADGPGSRTVRGRVTDSAGAFSDYTTAISISNVAPSVTLSNRTGNTTSPITFSATVSDPGVDTFTYLWNFGDGTTSTQANPSKQYTAIGTYTVTLKVTDSDGAATTKTATATISLPAPVGEIIDTGHDKIPNFGANPNIVAATSGNWSSPSTWSLGRVPQAGDIVAINNTFTVTYDTYSDAALKTVVINAGGKLIFRTDINTRLTVINFLVLEGGELRIGTEAAPVAPSVKAEVIFANVPLDLVNDPSQYGNGLIALGKVTMHGAVKSDTFVRLAVEPKAGDTTLTLAMPVIGWQVGDRLILPDTRQLSMTLPGQWERPTIAGVSQDGRVVTLAAPLEFDHLGARDGAGVIDYMPHVGNTTRNVLIRSQSATGVRGHTLFTGRADVDVRYVGFFGLGRTTNEALDNTTYGAGGEVTHIGTNQIGRYPVHFHHLMGPTQTPANGYQFTFQGNAVVCPIDPMPYRWGIALHDSHYGLVADNVLYNWAGAGIVTESGNETGNVIAHNFVVRVQGTGNRSDAPGANGIASEGVGIWLGGANNYVRDNVMADVHTYGYSLCLWGPKNDHIPNYQGADTSVVGQYTVSNLKTIPIREYARNEVYGLTKIGLSTWYLGADTQEVYDMPANLVKDQVVWHVAEQGLFGYPTNNFVFDGFVIRGNGTGQTTGLYFGDYLTANLIIRNADIQGMQVGIKLPVKVGDTSQTGQAIQEVLVENSYLRNDINIVAETMWAVSGGRTALSPRRTTIRNVRFERSDRWQYDIVMSYQDSGQSGLNLILHDELIVDNFNGVDGDDFRLYYLQQAVDFVIPMTQGDLLGAPVAGLTNQQAWDLYNIAIAGAVAPGSATTRTGLYGLVVSM